MVQEEKKFSVQDAAEYLGVSTQDVKYYVYQAKRVKLVPDGKFGRSIYFYEKTLAEFKPKMIPRGRPKRESDE